MGVHGECLSERYSRKKSFLYTFVIVVSSPSCDKLMDGDSFASKVAMKPIPFIMRYDYFIMYVHIAISNEAKPDHLSKLF